MLLFRVGDRVERTDAFVPTWMKEGIVSKIIPHKHGIDWATQYEVDFGQQLRGIFYQSQLRLVKADPPDD